VEQDLTRIVKSCRNSCVSFGLSVYQKSLWLLVPQVLLVVAIRPVGAVRYTIGMTIGVAIDDLVGALL
jgi:hypothetical protein